MTIISVDLMWSRQTSSDNSPDGKTFTSTYGSAYQVVHTIGETDDNIRYAPGIYIGNSYLTRRFAYCTNVAITSRPGPILSIVEITWVGESVPGSQDDPTNQEPVIRYYSSTTNEPVDTDGNGYPLTNVNGDVMEGFTKDVTDMVLEVTRNFRSVSGKLALQYCDSTNSDTMNVFGDVWQAGSGALQSFGITPVLQNGIVQYFNVTAVIMFRQAFNTIPSRAWWHRYRNEGLNERTGVTVAFSGGGGSGAAGYAVSASGGITAIVVTNKGRGYTSAPSITIGVTSGAPGSGATATCTISDGRVATASVTGAGTLYNSRLVPSVDGNKERVTKPVLLQANGQRESNADNAVWLERPKKSYSLPYSVLGLL